MRSGWNGAVPPVLPAPGPRARLRRAVRVTAALIWTAALFAVFLVLRGLDLGLRGLLRSSRPGLAPWAVQLWAHGALRLLGLRMTALGAPMRHPGAVVANHASWIDIVVLMRATRVFFVSKSEVAGWPAIGTVARAIGTIFIDRRPVEARRQTEALQARLIRGDRLCLFPEGTSTDGLRVLPFKSALFGVFLAPDLHDRLWVQPVSLRYAAPAGLPAAFYGWWGEMEFGRHLWTVLAHSAGGSVDVVFHEPLPAAAFSDRKSLAEAAGSTVRMGHAVRLRDRGA